MLFFPAAKGIMGSTGSSAIPLIGFQDQGRDRTGTFSYRPGRAAFTTPLVSGTVRNVSITNATATAPPLAFAKNKRCDHLPVTKR